MDAGPFKGAEKGNHEHEYRQGSGRQQDTADHGNRIEKSGDGAQGEVVHGLFFECEEKAYRCNGYGNQIYGRLGQPSFHIKVNAGIVEVFYGKELDDHCTGVEDKMGDGGVP